MTRTNVRPEKASAAEMLSFGGAQFATCIFMAFSAYYLMGFYTDFALIPPAATAVLLMTLRFYSAASDQFVGLFINRASFKGGKYLPYLKWFALPFAISLVALGQSPEISVAGKIAYAACTLLLCDLFRSVLNTAALSMLPYFAKGDADRTKFVSFANAGSILAYITVGTFMMPLANFFGGGDTRTGFALTLPLFALIAVPLHFNAYFRLKERHYDGPSNKPAIRDIFSAIARNRHIRLFMAGYCLYAMADSFKSQTTYYYMTYNMERPDLLPVIIMVGLLSSLAAQPIIPRLLAFVGKEILIVVGLFAAACSSFLMLAAGSNPFALIVCAAFYGMFAAVAGNLVFAVMASFADEIRERKKIYMSDVLLATMSLSYKVGIAIASGVAPMTMAMYGYSAQTASQPAATLAGIKALYILCAASGMALSGIAMLLFRYARQTPKTPKSRLAAETKAEFL